MKGDLLNNGVVLINPKWDKDTPCIPTSVLLSTGTNNKLTVRQAEAHIDDIRHFCITKSPSFASVIASVQHIVITPGHSMFESIAYTNGLNVYYGKGFFAESAKAQAAIAIHEVLHVALRHCQRAIKLHKDSSGRAHTGKDFNPYGWNLAVDAIVNMSVFAASWVAQPKCGVVNFTDLLTPEELKDWPAHTWSSESLYFNIMDKAKSGNGKGEDIQKAIGRIAKAIADVKNGTGSADSLLGDLAGSSPGDIEQDREEDTRNWNARLTRAAAGDRPGGFMRNALFDLPEVPTPWESHLRRMVTAAVMPTTELTPGKPSRHMLSKTAYGKCKAYRIPYEPGSQPKKGIKSIVVCVDTSGSIDDDILKRFCAEIQAIRNKVAANVTIISCDADVHQIINIPTFKTISQAMAEVDWKLQGGGGTDFRPAVEAAEKVEGAACIVYLTDMCGPFPATCKKPLIWASTMDTKDKPPCGRVIFLKDM